MKKILAFIFLLIATPVYAQHTIDALSAGTTLAGTELLPMFQTANPAVTLQGVINEAGAWVASPNGTVRTSMCHNMRLYWGTSGSC